MIDLIKNFTFPEIGNYKTSDENIRQIIYKSWNGCCGYTKLPLTFDEMVIDHIIPKKFGGVDNIFNYIPTTHFINSSKSDSFDEEAIISLLSLVRLIYAPKILEELSKKSTSPKHPLSIFFSDGMIKVLGVLFNNLDTSYSLRNLMSIANYPSGIGHRLLKELHLHGVIKDARVDNKRMIYLNKDYPFFDDLKSMFDKCNTIKS